MHLALVLLDLTMIPLGMPQFKLMGNQWLKLFTGLGTFKGDFEITIQPETKPFAIHTPRRVPILLRQKAKDELSRMESLEVI